MSKKIKADETIQTDLSKLIGAVTKDIQKEFDISNANINSNQKYLSTGNPGINYAFSGKFNGGFPQGKISELYGENSTGKSLLALHALVETQKQDGVPILVDSEFAFNSKWYENLGGDPKSLILYEPKYIEAVYDFVKKVVGSIREKNKDIPITIVYDSVAASPSKHEYEGGEHDMGKRAIAHGRGIRMLMGLCSANNVTFIATNQLRKQMGIMYGPDTDTVGGMAWKYATSLRARMKKGKKIEAKTPTGERVVGIHGSLLVEKNRLRAPFAQADFDIYFDQGIDPVSGLFDVLVSENIIVPRENDSGGITKGWWTYKNTHFQKSNFDTILQKYPELLGGHNLIKGYSDTILKEFNDGEDKIIETDSGESVEADM